MIKVTHPDRDHLIGIEEVGEDVIRLWMYSKAGEKTWIDCYGKTLEQLKKELEEEGCFVGRIH